MYVKEKGTEERLRKVNLREFMQGTELPEFDMSVKWRNKDENKWKKRVFNFATGKNWSSIHEE